MGVTLDSWNNAKTNSKWQIVYLLHVYEDGDITIVKHAKEPLWNSDLTFNGPEELFREIESYGQTLDEPMKKEIIQAPLHTEILI